MIQHHARLIFDLSDKSRPVLKLQMRATFRKHSRIQHSITILLTIESIDLDLTVLPLISLTTKREVCEYIMKQ